MSGYFGDILRQLREGRGLSINQLAIYSGVSSGLISKIENKKRGIPKPETIEKLAKGLKIKYEELMQKAGYIDNGGSGKSNVTNDQAKNAVIEIYTRLPQDKKKIIDDLIKALDEQS